MTPTTLQEHLTVLRKRHTNTGSASEVAYWTIRDAIRTGAIEPGARLLEVELSEALGMSRTPVREALRRLEIERLIENVPRRGLIVPIITLDDLVDVFEIREALEALAARRAAERISPAELQAMELAAERAERALVNDDLQELSESSRQFHTLLRGGSNSKKDRLPELIRLLEDLPRTWWLHEFAPDRSDSALREHRAILDALKARDPERAERLTREHIQNALKAQIVAHQRATNE